MNEKKRLLKNIFFNQSGIPDDCTGVRLLYYIFINNNIIIKIQLVITSITKTSNIKEEYVSFNP